jgi:hypothetical protein
MPEGRDVRAKIQMQVIFFGLWGEQHRKSLPSADKCSAAKLAVETHAWRA